MHALPVGVEYDAAAVELVDSFATFLASIAVVRSLSLPPKVPLTFHTQNAQHTPNLYAHFLHQLVAQRKKDSTASPTSTGPARTELAFFEDGHMVAGEASLVQEASSGYFTPMRHSRATSEDWTSFFQSDAFIFGQSSLVASYAGRR